MDHVAGVIYKITNLINGKSYIGQTTGTISHRFRQHAKARAKKQSPGLAGAIKKYGRENFTIELIAEARSIAELCDLEKRLIIEFKTKIPSGYNLSDGGENPMGIPVEVMGREFPSVAAAARFYGIEGPLVSSRLAGKWTLREALGIDPAPVVHSFDISVRGVAYESHAEASRAHGIEPTLFHSRLKSGWTVEQALGLDIPPTAVTYFGVTYESMTHACRAFGVLPATFSARLRMGWTERQAFGLDPEPYAIVFRGESYKSAHHLARAFGMSGEKVSHRLLESGWTIEQSLDLADPPGSLRVAGKSFRYMSEAAREYGVNEATVRFRLKSGWSVNQAFGIEPAPEIIRIGKQLEFKGISYPSVAALARAFSVPPEKLKNRLNLGWSIEQSIKPERRTRRTPGKSVTYNGVTYHSRGALARAIGLDPKVLDGRIRKGIPIEEAVKKTKLNATEIRLRDLVFLSIESAAKHFGLEAGTLRFRLQSGLTPEEAVGLVASKRIRKKKIDFRGKTYTSYPEIAREFGISPKLFGGRLRKGWTLEEAVNGKVRTKSSVTVNEIEFSSFHAACKYFDIEGATVKYRMKNGESIDEAFSSGRTRKYKKRKK